MSLHPAAAQLDALEAQQKQTSSATNSATSGGTSSRGEERDQEASHLLPDVNLMLSQQESVVNSTTSFRH